MEAGISQGPPINMINENRIMVVAGEASADAHAAAMIEELYKLRPGLEVYGVGGKALRAAGADLIADFSAVGVVGLTEVVPELRRFYSTYRSLLKSIPERSPHGVILLDLPDFNLILARKIKQINPRVRIIYYISPQVWGWRPGRVKKIAERVDSMLVLFPFEVDIYKDAGMDVEFVGHPLKDTAKPTADSEALRDEFGLSGTGPVIALLPGSRRAEVNRYLPVMAAAAANLLQERPGIQFVLARALTVDEDLIRHNLGPACPSVRMVSGRTCDVLAASDLALVASGTATLESAIIGVPMIVLGALSRLSSVILKPFSLVSHYSLPNIISGREIVPELIQNEMKADMLLQAARSLLDHGEIMEKMKEELFEVREKLGPGGASRRAALAVHQRLWKNKGGEA